MVDASESIQHTRSDLPDLPTYTLLCCRFPSLLVMSFFVSEGCVSTYPKKLYLLWLSACDHHRGWHWNKNYVKRHGTTNQSKQESSKSYDQAGEDRGITSFFLLIPLLNRSSMARKVILAGYSSTSQIKSELLIRTPPKNNEMFPKKIPPVQWIFHGKEHHRLSHVCPTAAPQTAASPATLCASEAHRSAHLNWPIRASGPQKNSLSSVVVPAEKPWFLKCVEHLRPPIVLVVGGTIFSCQVELLVEFRRLFQDVLTGPHPLSVPYLGVTNGLASRQHRRSWQSHHRGCRPAISDTLEVSGGRESFWWLLWLQFMIVVTLL